MATEEVVIFMNLYTNIDLIDNRNKVIQDVDAFFNLHYLNEAYINENIELIGDLEGGAYSGGVDYVDRFGRTLELCYMGTGTKAILLTINYPDYTVNYIEVGINHLAYLFTNIYDCNILLTDPRFLFVDESTSITLTINNSILCSTIKEFNTLVNDGRF